MRFLTIIVAFKFAAIIHTLPVNSDGLLEIRDPSPDYVITLSGIPGSTPVFTVPGNPPANTAAAAAAAASGSPPPPPPAPGPSIAPSNGGTSSNSNSTTSPSGASTPPSSNPSGGGAGQGFCNVVFNTGAPRNSGWPQNTWDSLTSNGVDNWIGFSLKTLDQQSTYNTDSGPAKVIPAINAAQIPIVMDPTYVNDALTILQSGSAPPFLELFNEPDYSYDNDTPLTDAVTAAQDLAPIFAASHPSTTYISPALANANSDWLPTFNSSCNGCFDQIPIVSMHLYNHDPNGALYLIQQLHTTWPDKKIWITELSPADGSCTLDMDGMVNWLNTLLPQIKALGYVEKIFWNCGENAPPFGNPECNSSLTNDDGSATALLNAYGAFCKAN